MNDLDHLYKALYSLAAVYLALNELEQHLDCRRRGLVVQAIDVLKQGQTTGAIEVRTSDNRVVHAKIYRADNIITTGSSNFSSSGLIYQIESNVRFTREGEPERWQTLCEYAEWVWEQGRDFLDRLLELLQQLLSHVTWQEALARACAEVLEGDWARRSLTRLDEQEAVKLWPTQRQGIAQALWIMENQGTVLIADAAGSGKTRMGAHLLKAIVERMWQTGRGRVAFPLLTCPKSVQDAWNDELRHCLLEVAIHTHGVLSRENSREADLLHTALHHAQIFAVDEAHNFLDRKSQRTRRLNGATADLVVLFTATPINKGTSDLIALIDLLGADNFDDDTAALVDRLMWRSRGIDTITTEEQGQLRHAIERFMVRRTIPMLNTAIERDPDAYTDSYGARCRYPAQHPQVYSFQTNSEDEALALQIRHEADQLRGLLIIGKRLQPMPHLDGCSYRSDQDDLAQRVHMANRLAAYQVFSSLRSSRAALIEHVYGTAQAVQELGIEDPVKAGETGNYVGKLQSLAGHVPESLLSARLPVWLADPEEHARACAEEMRIYDRIADLVRRMSTGREEAKARLLASLLQRHRKVVAFDLHVLTLSDMRQRLERLDVGEVFVATGADPRVRQRVRQLFDHEAGAPDVHAIALCSEAMGEAIGLQRASAIVHLDMPSTIRRGEQRIGRVARMNSPHREIDVFWPKESQAFALPLDERMVQRHETVQTLIGANLEMPSELTPELRESDQFLQDSEGALSTEWDNMLDAFAPVRGLVDGVRALIPPEVYERLRRSTAHVVSSVSVVQSTSPWTFLAVAGTAWGAPRWVYLDEESEDPLVDLQAVEERLRANLGEHIVDMPLDLLAAAQLDAAIHRLRKSEHLLLPRKKQRALEQMRRVLQKYLTDAKKMGDEPRMHLVADLLALLNTVPDEWGVDLRSIADCWLAVIAPYWTQRLTRPGRSRPLRIRELDKDLLGKDQHIPTETLQRAFEGVQLTVKSIDRRIAAAIVGVQCNR